MASPKTHVNKATTLVNLLQWLSTFQGAKNLDKQINTCQSALRLFANNQKINAR
jgi:hypothetical protein